MRYLTLKSNGKWQFRYQIPIRYREFFQNRREVKKTLHSCSKREAYLIGIEYELALKKFMAEITIGDHTSTFDEAYARTLIKRVAHTGVQQIYAVATKYRDEPAFKAALRQARATQDALGGEGAVEGQFSLDLTTVGALSCLKSIYPDEASARTKAKELIKESMMFDDTARNSAEFDILFNKLTMVFQHLINARIALENTDFKSATVIASQLALLSDYENKAVDIEEVAKFADNQIQAMFARGRKVVEGTQLQSVAKHEASESVDLVRAKASERKKNVLSYEEVISNYYREKKLFLFQKNTPKTEAEKKKVLKSLNQVVERARVVHTIIGKDDMHTIEREDVIMALEQLLLFPKDPIASKNKKYFEGIDKTEWIDINSHVNHEVILPTTAIIYLEDTGKIYNWLKEHGKASYNPFQKLAKAKHINIQEEKDKKQPFSKSDLKQIFNHKVFTELKLGVNPITRVILDYQYWMPLTSYLSGMRPNEAAQMKCKHVVNVDDIWCFEVTNTGEQESVKNVSSKRLVPIHSKLLELGILSLIESREPEELLFKDLTYSSEGYFRKVSDWFKRTFAIPMSLSKESKSYYSFRHNFMDPFVQSGNNGYVFKRLVGHTGDGVAERSYGKEADVKLLKELVESFDFGDVLDNVKPFSVGTAA